MPERRPADLTVRYAWDLAPADVTGRLVIEGTEGRYREQRGQSLVRFRFTASAAQLDALWQALHAQRLNTLGSSEAENTREGHETLTVGWDDRKVEIRDGAGRRVAAGDRERWRRIQVALRDLILAERRKRGLPEY